LSLYNSNTLADFTIVLQLIFLYIVDMVHKDSIKHVARNMAISINAERVILFGSYARGDATEQSDVDLMIIAKSNLPRFKRSRELYKLLRPHPFAMDIVVYTPHEVEKGKKTKVSFVSTVLKEGKTLYVRRNRSQQAMDSESKK
jgi:predicted nucleotidyltransferase